MPHVIKACERLIVLMPVQRDVQRFFFSNRSKIQISKILKNKKSYVPKSSTQKGVVKYDIQTSVDKSTTQVSRCDSDLGLHR